MPARILVVEDDPDSLEFLRDLLNEEGYEAVPAGHGEEALSLAAAGGIDLVLLDLRLPDMDGVEVCRRLKEGSSKNLPVIMVTARMSTDQKVAGLEAGADDYVTKPFENDELLARIRARLRIRMLEAENLKGKRALEEANQRLMKYISDLEESYLDTVSSLSTVIDINDPGTGRHSKNVADYAERIGKRLGLDDQQMRRLRYAAILHDIGKVGVPLSLLAKKSKLDKKEFEELKRHAERGESILKPVGFLADVLPIIRHHHEFLDGKGYPDALSGEGIPIEARIIAVADAYDAMTSTRPYRKAVSQQAAIKRLRAEAGKQFDRRVVEALVEILAEDGSL